MRLFQQSLEDLLKKGLLKVEESNAAAVKEK
jgi:hypothetical protein